MVNEVKYLARGQRSDHDLVLAFTKSEMELYWKTLK